MTSTTMQPVQKKKKKDIRVAFEHDIRDFGEFVAQRQSELASVLQQKKKKPLALFQRGRGASRV